MEILKEIIGEINRFNQFIKHFPQGETDVQKVFDKLAEEGEDSYALQLMSKLPKNDKLVDFKVINNRIFAYGSIRTEGNIKAEILITSGSIEAGGFIEVDKYIKAKGSIEAGGSIDAGDCIASGGSIEAGGLIIAGDSIEARGSIEAGDCITAGGFIEARRRIRAGEHTVTNGY